MTQQWEVPWYVRDDEMGDRCPPDFTPEQGPACPGQWKNWQCTRDQGHTGRHAAGTGRRIVAVWP